MDNLRTSAEQVINNNGNTLESTIGSIKGLTTSTSITESGYVMDAKTIINNLNTKQDTSTAINTSNIGNQTVNASKSLVSNNSTTYKPFENLFSSYGSWWSQVISNVNSDANNIMANGICLTIEGWNNLPDNSDGWGTLICFAASQNHIIQFFYSWNSKVFYYRCKNNNWTIWYQFSRIEEISNLATIFNIGNGNSIYCDSNGYMYSQSKGGLQVKSSDGNSFKICFASSFNQQSSKHSKTNISKITEEEARKILELCPISFDYKEKYGGEKNNFGLIAEDVNKIIPSCVNIPEGYDEENYNDDNSKEEILPSIDYSKLVPHLIKMIQIQEKRIEELEKDKLK